MSKNLLREAIERKLKKEEYCVNGLRPEKEALAALEETKPDLVWLDDFYYQNQQHEKVRKIARQSVAERFETVVVKAFPPETIK